VAVLSDHRIAVEISEGNLYVSSLKGIDYRLPDTWPQNLQPASVDLTLGTTVKSLNPRYLHLLSHQVAALPDGLLEYHRGMNRGGEWILAPGEWCLAATREDIRLPNYLGAVVAGKSSLAREGLSIENAGWVDPGWGVGSMGQDSGNPLTLEIKNLGPWMIALTPGMVICQIRFESLDGPCIRSYGAGVLGSHYQGSRGPVQSRRDQQPLPMFRKEDYT